MPGEGCYHHGSTVGACSTDHGAGDRGGVLLEPLDDHVGVVGEGQVLDVEADRVAERCEVVFESLVALPDPRAPGDVVLAEAVRSQ